jgi:hypothetical protein
MGGITVIPPRSPCLRRFSCPKRGPRSHRPLPQSRCRCFQIERGFSPASKSTAKRPTALPKAGAKPEGRSDRLIAVAFAFSLYLFFAFLAQKTHVKPLNRLTLSPSSTYIWRMRYPQSAIIKIGIKKEKAPASAGAFAFKPVSPLLTGIWTQPTCYQYFATHDLP